MNNMCLHCLDEGNWTDEDKCLTCEAKGHVSPWGVSKCPQCNKDYFTKMGEIREKMYLRIGKENEEMFKLLEYMCEVYKDKDGYICLSQERTRLVDI